MKSRHLWFPEAPDGNPVRVDGVSVKVVGIYSNLDKMMEDVDETTVRLVGETDKYENCSFYTANGAILPGKSSFLFIQITRG